LDLELCAPQACSSPLAFTGANSDWLCPRADITDDVVWVCDAIPQRNCGRFSRPFLFPKVDERTPDLRTVGSENAEGKLYSYHHM
jgi:hypothetical protein